MLPKSLVVKVLAWEEIDMSLKLSWRYQIHVHVAQGQPADIFVHYVS